MRAEPPRAERQRGRRVDRPGGQRRAGDEQRVRDAEGRQHPGAGGDAGALGEQVCVRPGAGDRGADRPEQDGDEDSDEQPRSHLHPLVDAVDGGGLW